MTYTRIIRVVVDNICCWLFFVKNCVLFIKTFPILCTIYNKVVTKYSSVLNCKTVLR